MPVHIDPPSPASSGSPMYITEANLSSSLSRNTSVISSSSSSSSLLTAPVPVRTFSAPRSASPSRASPMPSSAGRPPAWLSRHFGQNTPSEPSGDQTPMTKPTSSPASPSGARQRMTSPDDFEFGEELGGGSWSTVLEAIYPPTSKRYAIKILNKAQLLKEKMTPYAVIEKNALVLLSSGGHPGIVRLYSAFHDTTSLYLVLSLAPNGDLKELVKTFGSFSVPSARYYAAQIVDTVQWMHGKGVLHRDLKPENILLDSEMRIKLTDFGSAYIAKDLDLSPRASTFVGTAAYVSPELLSGPVKTTSQSSDIWAIGCMLYFLMIGQSPFLALNDYLSFKKIEALDYTFPDGFDADAQDLVQRLLVLEPSDRLGAHPKSSTSALREHPFFIGHPPPGSDDTPASFINWETLWTDHPVKIESGLVPAPARERGEDADHFSWNRFIHEFSLVTNDDPPDSIRNSDDDERVEVVTADTPIDTPGHPVNGQPHTPPISAHAIQDTPSSAPGSPTDAHERISEQESGSDDPTQDINMMVSVDSWSSVLIPPETMRLVAQVDTRSRRRLVQKTQRRVLVLTSFPRLICAKLGKSGPSLVVKQVFAFPVSGVVAIQQPRNMITGIESRGKGSFDLETPDKSYTYTPHDQAEANRWVKEVRALLALGSHDRNAH